MSWVIQIFNRLDLKQAKLLLWFLHGETRYVEADGPRFETSVTPLRLIMSDAFRGELRSEISRAITQPDQSPFRKEATHA